jgi:hypothetical protein
MYSGSIVVIEHSLRTHEGPQLRLEYREIRVRQLLSGCEPGFFFHPGEPLQCGAVLIERVAITAEREVYIADVVAAPNLGLTVARLPGKPEADSKSVSAPRESPEK